jgi:hypothetical protein
VGNIKLMTNGLGMQGDTDEQKRQKQTQLMRRRKGVLEFRNTRTK